MDAIRSFRPRENQKLPLDVFQTALGALNHGQRMQQREILQWMSQNLDDIDRRVVRAHYGFLLHRLRKGSTPLGPLVRLLVKATDKTVVTQGRLALVTTIWMQDRQPAVGRLLHVMRQYSSVETYVQPLGQSTALDARIPLKAMINSSVSPRTYTKDLQRLSTVNTRAYKALVNSKSNVAADVAVAELLASLYVLAEASQHVLVAVEQFIHEYGAGLGPASLEVVARFFRFWQVPGMAVSALRDCPTNALTKLMPELWHLGPEAASLVEIVSRHTSSSRHPRIWIQIYQFYMWTALVPPQDIVARLVGMPGGLVLCSDWATEVPDICRTLQGEFCLPEGAPDDVKDAVFQLLGESRADIAFCFANSPWLGSASGRTFRRLLAESNPLKQVDNDPEFYTPETLEPLGQTYADMCSHFLDDLSESGLDISMFLKSHNGSPSDMGDHVEDINL